jgi:ribosome-binding factor A
MVDQARARRLAKRISRIVADALEHEVKDPRLTMVTITDTRVTGDLRDATVYYTVLGRSVDDVPDSAGAAAALASATGVLRSMVGAGTGVRFTPTLTFVPDVVPDEARRMEELLARTRESDAEVARRAVGALPAGDPDPYRYVTDEDEEPGDDVPVLPPAPVSASGPHPGDETGRPGGDVPVLRPAPVPSPPSVE